MRPMRAPAPANAGSPACYAWQTHPVRAVDVQNAEQCVIPTTEVVPGHRHRDWNIHTHHADLHLALELARKRPGTGEDTDAVAVAVGIVVDAPYCLAEVGHAYDDQYRAETES